MWSGACKVWCAAGGPAYYAIALAHTGFGPAGGGCLCALAMRVVEGLVRPVAGEKKNNKNDKQTFDQKGVPRTRETSYAGGGVQAVACVCSKVGF